MTPARFRAWVERARKHTSAHRIRAQHNQLGVLVPVGEWPLDQLTSEDELNAILQELQEHCDGIEETARYTLESVGAAGEVLSTTVHRCQPYRAHSGDASQAADSGSPNALVAMLVRHLENREKLLAGHTQISLGAIGTMLQNMQQLMQLQGTEMRSLREQNSTLVNHLQARATEDDSEQSEHDRAEAIARTNALNKVAELGPDVLRMVLAHYGIDPRMGGRDGNA